jgi:DNA-binding response OmpR family regulator
MSKILFVDDDIPLGLAVASTLEMKNHDVKFLSGGWNILQEIKEFHPDIILLDVVLNEKIDGFEIGRQIRSNFKTPIIFTTALDGNDDIDAAFSIINTDYIRKPYRALEIIKRIERMLQKNLTITTYNIGTYIFLPCERVLKYELNEINLNHLEAAVLSILYDNLSKFVSREEIIKIVWNLSDSKLKDKSLNNILSSLRKCFEQDRFIEIECRNKLGVRMIVKNE